MHFVREGDITTVQSIEAGASFCDEIIYTYLTPNNRIVEHIGREWWISFNPKEDKLTPETTFTDRRLTYQLPPKPDDEAKEEEVNAKGTNDEE